MNRRAGIWLLLCLALAGVIISQLRRSSVLGRVLALREFNALNARPIEFYGITVDQLGAAVPEVEIRYDVRVGGGAKPIAGSVISDKLGRFTIAGYNGERLVLNPKKQGYRVATTNAAAIYSLMWLDAERYQGSLTYPTMVRLWKLKGAEELVSIQQEYRLNPGDNDLLIDLLQGKVVESGGDLRVIVKRGPGNLSKGELFDWSYRLIPVAGEIQVVERLEHEITYAAPTTGYSSSFDRAFLPTGNAPRWSSQEYLCIYMKSRNGSVYLKTKAWISINKDDEGAAFISLQGVANPNGSPNWEEDPQKMHPPR